MTEPTPQPLDLDEIATRAAALYEYGKPDDAAWEILAGDDVPALLGELRRARAERDQFADRVDTLTAVAKGNKRHVQSMFVELQKAQRERDEARTELAAEKDRYRAGLRKADEQLREMNAELERYAVGEIRPVMWSVYNRMHGRAATAEARVAHLERELAKFVDSDRKITKAGEDR